MCWHVVRGELQPNIWAIWSTLIDFIPKKNMTKEKLKNNDGHVGAPILYRESAKEMK